MFIFAKKYLLKNQLIKTTLIIETNTRSQMESMFRFLKKAGIGVSLVKSNEDLDWEKLGLQQMEEECSQPENDHWDNFFKTSPKL